MLLTSCQPRKFEINHKQGHYDEYFRSTKRELELVVIFLIFDIFLGFRKKPQIRGPQIRDVGRSRSQLWTPFTILWTPFTIWQKLWTAPPKFPEKSRFFRNISNSIILWKNVISEPNSFLDLKFSYFKAFWVEAHERFQRLRVFHAQPLSSFSCKSFNESPLGAGPNSYSTKS